MNAKHRIKRLSCLLLGVSFCLMFLKEDIEELEQLEREQEEQ